MLVLMLMIISTQFSLAYTCACVYVYALVKTRLKEYMIVGKMGSIKGH